MSEWKEYRLGELASVIPGFAFKGKDFGVNGCRVVKIGDITPPIVDVTNCLRIPTDKINGLDKFKLQKGDFVLAMTGATLGKVGKYRSEETGYINQRVAKFENIKGISDKHFLYYLITSNHVTNEIINRGLGSAQPNISGKDIETINVVAPDLPTQTAIAEILSSLDDKIELNNKINQELENLAQTLFKQWFIDFEFPNENGEPYKSSGGEMVDSELGEIPKGWEVGAIEALTTKMNSGGTPSTRNSDFYDGEILWYSTKELKDNFMFESDRTITINGLNSSSAKLFPAYTVVMAIYAAPTVGRLGILNQEAAFNQAALGFVAKEEVGYEFIYLLLKFLRDDFNNLANGAAQQNLNVGLVKNYKILMPLIESLRNFKSLMKPIFESIKNNQLENNFLTNLRDTLLPKLISGELEVSQIKTTS